MMMLNENRLCVNVTAGLHDEPNFEQCYCDAKTKGEALCG